MAKGNNQKLKLLYMAKFFAERTDDSHGLTVQDFIRLLNECGISADRKTLYHDFEELRHFGMDIVDEKNGRNVYYFLASRDFELPELKLLVDTVQSAKFITESKSRELIKKLETLTSAYEAKQLQRQVIISGRVKTINESIYYSVDQIHSAISQDTQIEFQYYQWNVKKEMELRHDGAIYHVSPWSLVWDDEYYYLIGYDRDSSKIKHYRVDKMLHIAVTDRRREGRDVFEKMDLPKYSNGLFGMYGGEETSVTLLCKNNMAGTIIDRFGTDVSLIPADSEHFTVRIRVSASKQFLGWVFALGSGVRITAPESMVNAMREEARRLADQYRLSNHAI